MPVQKFCQGSVAAVARVHIEDDDAVVRAGGQTDIGDGVARPGSCDAVAVSGRVFVTVLGVRVLADIFLRKALPFPAGAANKSVFTEDGPVTRKDLPAPFDNKGERGVAHRDHLGLRFPCFLRRRSPLAAAMPLSTIVRTTPAAPGGASRCAKFGIAMISPLMAAAGPVQPAVR
jgi:hypothetical protein